VADEISRTSFESSALRSCPKLESIGLTRTPTLIDRALQLANCHFMSASGHRTCYSTPRQIRAPCAVLVIHLVRAFLWTVAGNLIEPINHFGIAATIIDQAGQAIAASAAALLTGHPQHVELADQITEDDCAVAGYAGATLGYRVDLASPRTIAQAFAGLRVVIAEIENCINAWEQKP